MWGSFTSAPKEVPIFSRVDNVVRIVERRIALIGSRLILFFTLLMKSVFLAKLSDVVTHKDYPVDTLSW